MVLMAIILGVIEHVHVLLHDLAGILHKLGQLLFGLLILGYIAVDSTGSNPEPSVGTRGWVANTILFAEHGKCDCTDDDLQHYLENDDE